MTRGRLPGCEAIRRKEPAVLLNMNDTKKGGNVHRSMFPPLNGFLTVIVF